MLTIESRPALKATLSAALSPHGDLVLTGTPKRRVVVSPLSSLRAELLLLLDGSRTVSEIAAALRRGGQGCTDQQILDELQRLDDELVLEPGGESDPGEDGPSMRYDRSRLFFAAFKREGRQYAREVEAQLRDTHVALFGLGGFGCHILYQLTALGVGEITAIDFDRVEWSNLNRQALYTEPDVGRPKVKVARERCQSMNSSAAYHFFERRIGSSQDFAALMRGTDLAILAADTPRPDIFEWMNDASFETGVAALYSLGIGHTTVHAGPLVVPGSTACFKCAMPSMIAYDHPVVQFVNTRHCSGSLAPTVMIAAGTMVFEALKHLTGFEPCQLYDQRMLLDMRTYATTFRKIDSKKGCPYCGARAARGNQ